MKNAQSGFIGVIIIVLVALAAVGGGAYVYRHKSERAITAKSELAKKTNQIENKDNSVQVPNADSKNGAKIDTPVKAGANANVSAQAQISSSDPWAVFDKYKAYANAHDEAGMNSLSHIQSPKCGGGEECDSMFALLGSFLNSVNKADYTDRWEDSKQAILTGGLKKSSTAGDASVTRNSLLFTKDSLGNLKFLTMVSYSNMEAAMTDSDKDGLTDQEEKCEGTSKYRGNCKVTDPAKRDSDGDGWWDGIEARF